MIHLNMKKITVKNLNQLSYKDQKLKGNLGLWAEANKNGTISFRIMKRIKRVSNKSYKSPFRGTLGHYPEMSIKEAEIEAKRIIAICNKGLHPRKSEPKIDKWTPDKNLQRKLLIVGTGGHSNSVASVAKSSGYKISAFVDKSKTKKKNKIYK